MSLVAEWRAALCRGLSALAGGRAPMRWRGQLARDTAWPADLARNSAWVARFDPPASVLLAWPLWGRSLELLVGEAAAPLDTAEPEPAVRQARGRPEVAEPPFGHPGGRPDAPRQRALPRPRASMAPGRPAELQRRADLASGPPAGLPRQAGRALLDQLVASVPRPMPGVLPSTLSEQVKVPAGPPVPERRHPFPPGGTMTPMPERRHPLPPGGARAPADGGAASRLGQEMAHRAGRSLHAALTAASGRAPGVPRLGVPEVPGAPTGQEEFLEPAWRMRLDGPVASPELLVRLAGRRDRNPVTERREVLHAARPDAAQAGGQAGKGRGTAPRTPQGDGARSPVSVGPSGSSTGKTEPSFAAAREGRSFLSGAADIWPLLRETAPEPAVTAPLEEGVPPVKEIAPPAIAEGLPPLAPLQRQGAPSLAVATGMAWAGAEAEASAFEEDMEVLAAKIKRILDEEARRYGIDV